jgi:hypothetical protein
MPNLKKKYWHGRNGTPLANEMSAQELQNLAEVVENVSNQTQEPDEAMNAYLSKIKNNTFRSAVDKVFNSATDEDINNMARENAAVEAAATGTG